MYNVQRQNEITYFMLALHILQHGPGRCFCSAFFTVRILYGGKTPQNGQSEPDGVPVYPAAWASSRLLPATSLKSGSVCS